MRKVLVTTCTGRKKAEVLPSLHVADLPEGDQDSLLSAWSSRLKSAPRESAAKDLYCGRGFSAVLRASVAGDADLYVISAGLGLISGDDRIPPYNLTISASSEDSIRSKVVPRGTFLSRKWWRDLNVVLYSTPTPLADLIREKIGHLFVLPLTRSYAEMIKDDLLSLSLLDLQRVRIVGLGRDYCISEKLKSLCMPYDERFDGPDGIETGTRSDFPQRTARHFIESILTEAEQAPPVTHAAMVTNYLEGKRYPDQIKRAARTDDEIKEIINSRWVDAGGTSARMLRLLRDDEKVACEQKRFSQLFNSVKAVKNDPT